jgi:hypothetical protein
MRHMSRVAQESIATTILAAPAWARVGITAPSERMRDDAARELARAIVERIAVSGSDDPDQLALRL